MELIIEFGETGRAGYGSIHRKGVLTLLIRNRSATPRPARRRSFSRTRRHHGASNEGSDPADFGYKIASCVTLPAR